MGVDEIITLEDGKEFILLAETMLEGEKYFMAVEAVDNKPSENYALFKQVIENNELSVEEVEEDDIKLQLLDLFEEQIDEIED